MSTDRTKDLAPAGTSERHLALLGGWRRPAGKAAPERALKIAVVGGANIDLGTSAFPAAGTTLTTWAIAGGVDVTVPAGTRVTVSGFNLIGRRRIEVAPGDADGPELRIRAFAAVGGVHVHTAA
ncbi:MAG: hypothetical protein AAGC46_09015 [Solirubrobacteraceae bacterium]